MRTRPSLPSLPGRYHSGRRGLWWAPGVSGDGVVECGECVGTAFAGGGDVSAYA